jgi:hypothetical protein
MASCLKRSRKQKEIAMARQTGSGGGGFGSRVVTERPVRTGAGSYATSPGYVGQLGNKQGSPVTRGQDSNYRGEPFHSGRSFQPAPFGNEVAANTVCGPGGSREVMRSGGQGMHGGVNRGNPQPRQSDILSGYGPESSSRARNPRSNPGRFTDTEADF